MQRGAGVGHDNFTHIEAFKISVEVSDDSPTSLSVSQRYFFDHLNGQTVNGGMRYGDAATALGVDIGASEHPDPGARIVGERDPDVAELARAIDLRRHQPDPSDEIGPRCRG